MPYVSLTKVMSASLLVTKCCVFLYFYMALYWWLGTKYGQTLSNVNYIKRAFTCIIYYLFLGTFEDNRQMHVKLRLILPCFDAKYFPQIRYFESLFKPVLIGLGVRYFDTMRTTVTIFVFYQKVIFGKYWIFEVLTRHRR